jgi:hydrogenase assembly chaperone HypC/HupF
VGKLSGVEPDALRFCFELVVGRRREFGQASGHHVGVEVASGAGVDLHDPAPGCHPAVAAESAGALFDSTEIDEILTLRPDMCLGIPGRVVELVEGYEGQLVMVDVQGAVRKVNAGMLEEPLHAGDWVLLHLGFAMAIIDEAEAHRAMSGLELMGRPIEAP